MRVVQVDGLTAICEAKGVRRSASLYLLDGAAVAPGDQVLIHVGYAIQKISEDDARATWSLLDEMLSSDDSGAGRNHA